MPPPEKTERQTGPNDGVIDGLGLRLEARVKSPTWEVAISGVIDDFAQGEVILLMADPITERTHVSVQANTSVFAGEILYCQPRGSLWETHVSFDDVDASGLRRTPRFPVRIPARVFSSTNEQPLEAMILDVSGDGLGIELAEPVKMGTRVAVQSEESTALGEVKHCRELKSGRFRAGVFLHHIMKKNQELEEGSGESNWMGKLARRFKMG
ncbi:MAG TPA: PilZ domain-containing protein [Bryobacteraceae bacterium]|nr:PilZ domain-containing protein [Bryobacteraceae bacterium]